jgi:hypothetical protein
MLLDEETGDLRVEGGGLVVGDATGQVTRHVLLASPGEFKEHPLVGAGIYKLANGQAGPFWGAEARQMLRACGVPATRVTVKGNLVTVE